MTAAFVALVLAGSAAPAAAAPDRVAQVAGPDLHLEAGATRRDATRTNVWAFVGTSGSDATGVVIEVEVPVGMVIDSATYGWWSTPCTVVGRTATCSVGRVRTTNQQFIGLEVRAVAAGVHQIQVSTRSDVADADPSDNTAVVPVDNVPNLSTTVVSPTDVALDAAFDAWVEVAHEGPTSTGAVAVIDVTPGLSVEAATVGWFSVPCTIAGSTLTCPLGNISGAYQFVSLRLRGSTTGSETISASVTTTSPDRNAADDADQHVVAVGGVELLDVSLLAIAHPAVVGPGQAGELSLQMTNKDQTRDATGIVVESTLPDGFTVTSAAPSHGGTCSIAGRTVTCNLADLGPGYTQWATIAYVAPPTYGDHELGGTVSTTRDDPEPADNTATDDLTVGPPDLSAQVPEWPTTATVGTSFPARVDIANRGATDPAAVLRIETTPGMVIESAAIGWFSKPCTISGTTATCSIGKLGNTIQFVLIRVRPTAAGTHTVTATAGNGGPDLDPSDNVAVATVTAS